MEVIPLTQGDPAWVFGADAAQAAVSAPLHEAADATLALAQVVQGRVGWTGAGLEFHALPASETGPPQVASLTACAEVGMDATFLAELTVEDGCFVVEAGVSVRCDAEQDCGMHEVQALPEVRTSDAVAAATALLAATRWLHEQGVAHPVEYWRRIDARSGHR